MKSSYIITFLHLMSAPLLLFGAQGVSLPALPCGCAAGNLWQNRSDRFCHFSYTSNICGHPDGVQVTRSTFRRRIHPFRIVILRLERSILAQGIFVAANRSQCGSMIYTFYMFCTDKSKI